MGLLDDAIREHLELKRKHGADPEDVARQEQEALGPGKRNEFAQPDAEEEAVAEAPAEPVGDPEPPLNEEPPADAEPEPSAPAGYDEDPWLDEDRDEVPAEEALQRQQQPQPPRTGEEDVLEETPDFLQETPEHDRLWF